ncbi:hypothetical protein NMG60_11004427 [Bertholletia excelsa]
MRGSGREKNTESMEKNRANSFKSNRSMSDTDSQVDSFHSPLRFESPLRSDDPETPPEKSPAKSLSKAIIPFGLRHSPGRSPNHVDKQKPGSVTTPPPAKAPSEVIFGRSVREDVRPGITMVEQPRATDGGVVGDVEDGVGGERRARSAADAILRRSRREVALKKAELGIRVCEVVLCLISFSVMAADKTQGWSGDSFDRYKEYRYCLSMTVIGFVYSGFQACDLAYSLASGKPHFFFPLRYHFDFAMDQILAYLLISASSSAATRVDDWVSNWGKDEFTEMASASVSMSFLAFAAFALSSLISGYTLCNRGIP